MSTVSQKEVAKYKCEIVLGNVNKDVIETVMNNISPKLKVKNQKISGNGEFTVLHAEVEYGPVKGAYASDVRSFLKRAQKKAGVNADMMIMNGVRELVKTSTSSVKTKVSPKHK